MLSIGVLVAIALLPAVVLCVYVFKKDRLEKESFGLLGKLFVLGIVSCIPAVITEIFGDAILDLIFPNAQMYLSDDEFVDRSVGFYLYMFLKFFMVVALSEEFFKRFFLIRMTRKNKEFNCVFDGLIYSVFVALGFAAFENVLYVVKGGIGVGIMRMVLAVPGHMFDGVIMGYYYSMWHITEIAAEIEASLETRGIISNVTDRFSGRKNRIMSLVVPVLAHGFYDFCCSVGTVWGFVVFLAFIVYLYVRCFKMIRKMSEEDSYDTGVALEMVRKKYPDADIEDFYDNKETVGV